MLFNSFEFLVFAPVALIGAALLHGLALRVWLVILSYIFYGWANPVYCLLLLASTVLDFHVARGIHATDDARRRRLLLTLSVVGNLGLLAVFKYAGFAAQTVNAALGLVGDGAAVPVPDIALPIGISFYTFQTMSYTIDVYRGKMAPTDRFSVMALYVAFFPQLVAGPIERADHLMHQLAERRRRDPDDVLAGISRILWGLLKKVVFADSLAFYANAVYGSSQWSSNWDYALATYCFAFQIYLDFSAYSDIAIGLSRTMGIDLRENFRWPYLARNVSEFWRRWHISLSTWLRDYLYIPLGGSRRGPWRTFANVLTVMFLGGLWHGADWKFVVWGLWIGVALGVHQAWSRLTGLRVDEKTPIRLSHLPAILLTFHTILISWVFFRAETIGQAIDIFRAWLGPWGPVRFRWDGGDMLKPQLFLVAVIVAHVVRGLGWTDRLTRVRSPYAVGAFWGVTIVLIALLFASLRARFIYFQF